MQLPLNEFFKTIQGEGSKTGTPSTFLRLQGCEVGCPWCDTKYTWDMDRFAILHDVVAKTSGDHRFAWASLKDLLALIGTDRTHVVITGGEPCKYDLRELTGTLIDLGHSVQIETSGTERVQASNETFVTLSPKIDMPGGKTIKAEAVERADEFKMPVGKMADVLKLDALLASRRAAWGPGDVWLQPLSESRKATELCREVAALRGWRVSLQMHKQADVR
jgi:7-carboxy-7-deazaguanine synthase